jgi:very-short-patch-repair endonuclease
VWKVPNDPIAVARHLTTGPRAQVRTTNGVVVHRCREFRCEPPFVVERNGIYVVRLETAIVTSWPLLKPGEQRKPAIEAVNSRLTTGARLRRALDEIPAAAGAQEMRALFGLLTLGCRSELELWGHDRVFTSATLPPARLQFPVPTSAGRFVLDRAYPEAMVGVELDGAAWHGSAAQRERDVRRDAALAAVGWLIVRFTYHRLTADPEGCREDLRRILALRRRQLAVA